MCNFCMDEVTRASSALRTQIIPHYTLEYSLAAFISFPRNEHVHPNIEAQSILSNKITKYFCNTHIFNFFS